MIRIVESVDIDAQPAEVFRLLCDPERKARLNPGVTVLQASVMTPGPIARGARIRYRLCTTSGVSAFDCEVTEFEPDHVIEVQSQAPIRFTVRQSVDPHPGGCRLVHQESAEIGPARLRTHAERHPLPYLLQLLRAAAGLVLPSADELEETQTQTVADEMRTALRTWLTNIKTDLESNTSSEVMTASAV